MCFPLAWEQRKLGDIAHRITRKNEGESDLPLTISAQYGLVDQRSFFNNQVASKDMSGGSVNSFSQKAPRELGTI